MADKRMNLELFAKVRADVSDVKGQLETLKNSLNGLKIPKESSKELLREIKKLQEEIINFEANAKKGVNSLEDVKAVEHSWKKVTTLFNKTGLQLDNLKLKSKDIIPTELFEGLEKANKALDAYEKKIVSVKKSKEYLAKKKEADLAKTDETAASNKYRSKKSDLENLRIEQDAIRKKWEQEQATYEASLKRQASLSKKINEDLGEQNAHSNFLDQNKDKLTKDKKNIKDSFLRDVEAAKANQNAAKSARESSRKEITNLIKQRTLDIRKLQELDREEQQLLNKHGPAGKESKRFAEIQSERGQTKARIKISGAEIKRAKAQFKADSERYTDSSVEAARLENEKNSLENALAQINTLKKKIAEARQSLKVEAEENDSRSKTKESLEKSAAAVTEAEDALVGYKAKMEEATATATKLQQELDKFTTDGTEEEWRSLVEEIKKLTGVDVSSFGNDTEKIKKVLADFKTEKIKEVPAIIEKIKNSFAGAKAPIDRTSESIRGVAKDALQLKKASDEAEHLKNSILQFFSIGNTIQLFKRAIKDAIGTVKELDKAMTDTAVVTDFSVSDMWKELPKYTNLANELGTTTLGAYQTMTLFYQQGLDTEEAFGVGTEAMKMARIAGLDYANATNLMTAALRGFNMEVDESSAQRINDVYSELAAITAADTEEIARAMTKTASIAHNAGMEFETTSAFLSQIIETTRESAETAGTAMKTVIARFQEMRKSPSEIGEVDGEFVDANKIEAALRSVGVALRDNVTGQFRDLDDVFLELASKWDSLDTNTQRYIATIAAGSRQQSRFIAMMSDYERTMELVEAANTSAGASQHQFEKTMDSLESKLNTLKNAWDEFTMGLTNNKFIKGGVEVLTELLNIVNDLTTGTGEFSSSILKLSTVLISMRAGGAIFRGLTDNWKNYGPEVGNSKLKFMTLTLDQISKFRVKSERTLGRFEKRKGRHENGMLSYGFWGTLGQKILQVGANIKLLGKSFIAFLASPVGITVGVITGLIASFIVLKKTIQSTTKEARLAVLNEQGKQFEQTMGDAKDALKQLRKEKDNLAELGETFDGLARGTVAWKQALIDSNEQVLELIKKFPMLNEGLTNDQYGRLQISEDSWKKVIEHQNFAVMNLQNANYMKQMEIEGLNNAETFDNFAVSKGLATKGAIAIGDFMDAEAWDWLQKLIKHQGGTEETWGEVFERYFPLALFATEPVSFKKTFTNLYDNLDISQNGGYAANSYSEDFGINRQQFIELAAAVGRSGIRLSDNEGNKDLHNQDWLAISAITEKLGYSYEDGQSLVTSIMGLGNEFDALAGQAIKYQLAMDEAERGIISNTIKNGKADINDKNLEAITNLIRTTGKYQNMDSVVAANEAQIKERIAHNDPTFNLLKEYSQKTGNGFYSNGKLYTDGSMSEEMTIAADTDALTTALATAMATEGIGAMADAFEAALYDGASSSQKILLNSTFSNEGEGITGDLLSRYGSDQGIQNLIAETGLKDKAESLGMSIEEITKTLMDNFTAASDRIYHERKGLVAKMTKSSKKGEKNFKAQAVHLAALEKTLGDGFRATLANVYESLERSADQDVIDAGSSAFLKAADRDMVRGNTKDTDALAEFDAKLDLSNPITALAKLKKGLKDGNAAIREYSGELLNAGKNAFSAGSQIQYLTKTAVFTDIQEDVKKIVDANGEVDSDNVLALAEDYEELNLILEQTGITAGGLGEILEKLGDNSLGINQLTDTVMASLKGFEGLDSMVAGTLKKFEDFDPGINENDFASYINDAYEAVDENLKKGAYGNTQNFSYLDFLLGPDWRKGIPTDQLDEQMRAVVDKIGKNKENMKDSWKDLASGKNFYGQDIAKQVLDNAGLTVTESGEEIVFGGYKGKTTQEIVAVLQEAYGVSKNYAEAMLGDFKNYSNDLALELNQNDFTAGIKSAYEVISEKKYVDQTEIQTIAELYGKSYEEVLQAVQDMARRKGDKISFTSFFDKDGFYKETSEIVKELNRISGPVSGSNNPSWMARFNNNNSLDFSAAENELKKYEFDSQQRLDIIQASIQQQIDETKQAVTVQYKDAIYGLQTLTIGAGESLQDKIEQARNEAEKADMKQFFQDTFSDIEIKFTTVDENTAEVVASIKSLGDDPVPITLSPNTNATRVSIKDGLSGIVIPVELDYGELPTGGESKANSEKGAKEYGKRASGIKNALHSETALVGEGTGPELVQKANGAYLAGLDGPEIANIAKGDTIYTAEETRHILKKRNHSLIPRFEGGQSHGYGGVTSGNSGGGSAKDNESEWKNSFDMLYNLLRQINEEQRQRNRIERRYEQELKKIGTNTSELVKISIDELKQLDFEKQAQNALRDRRTAELEAFLSKNGQFKEYGDVSTNQYGEKVVRIDWEKIDAITDQDLYKDVEEYIKQLEEWVDEITEVEDTLNDIDDQIEEIKERGKDQYLSLENRIKDALIKERQDYIDQLGEINSTLTEGNSKIINAMEQSISKARQDRENERTEKELQEKYRKIAYLSQDTSNANDLDILQLQKELAESEEDYTDTLIDQKITYLQEQNDQAAEQRQQQIDILTTQLQHYEQTGQVWADVHNLLENSLNAEDSIIHGSALEVLLQKTENWNGMSELQKVDWLEELENQVAEGMAFIKISNTKQENLLENMKQIVSTPHGSGGSTHNTPSNGGGSNGGNGSTIGGTTMPSKPTSYTGYAKFQHYYFKDGQIRHFTDTTSATGSSQSEANSKASEYAKQRELQTLEQAKGERMTWYYQQQGYGGSKNNSKTKFATGGLADFTGPAWLDGTKSKPEVVLNARDSKNFIQLRDVLSSIYSGSGLKDTQNSGDNSYDIDINVEKIGNDYDVDQLASKIERLINSKARYRNNNTIGLSR